MQIIDSFSTNTVKVEMPLTDKKRCKHERDRKARKRCQAQKLPIDLSSDTQNCVQQCVSETFSSSDSQAVPTVTEKSTSHTPTPVPALKNLFSSNFDRVMPQTPVNLAHEYVFHGLHPRDVLHWEISITAMDKFSLPPSNLYSVECGGQSTLPNLSIEPDAYAVQIHYNHGHYFFSNQKMARYNYTTVFLILTEQNFY